MTGGLWSGVGENRLANALVTGRSGHGSARWHGIKEGGDVERKSVHSELVCSNSDDSYSC